jgi:hypothetical protein
MVIYSLLFGAAAAQVVCAAFLLKTSQEPEAHQLHRCLECGAISEPQQQQQQ